MPIKGKLTKQQRRFCEAYVNGLAEKRPDWWAAWQAGCCNTRRDVEPPSHKIPQLRSRASKLLNGKDFPHVPPYIDRLRAEKRERQAQVYEREVAKMPSKPALVARGREGGERRGQAQGLAGPGSKLCGLQVIAKAPDEAANRRRWRAALEIADLGPHRHEIERMLDQMTGARQVSELLEST